MIRSSRPSGVRLALPSKGMESETLGFMASCGLKVRRPNPRQYEARVNLVPDLTIVFQRAADIYAKVDEGSVDLGITGLDIVREHEHEGSDVIVLNEGLGYGGCSLVLAVPESWLDVASVGDLAEVAAGLRSDSRELRVATKFTNLTQSFLYEQGVNYFSLVESQGAIEAAPRMGYADVISDIVETGTTLKDNGLKTIAGGVILRSQACLIGNRRLLRENSRRLEVTKTILELVEARMRSRAYNSITANVRAGSADEAAARVSGASVTAGLKGPTVAQVHTQAAGEDGWYAVTVIIRADDLLTAVDHLRSVGATSVSVQGLEYVFEATCLAYEALLDQLQLRG